MKRQILLFALSVALTTQGFAYENIIKPYQSARTSGMGGMKLTTGLYDENFFGNPARATDNPKWRVQLIDPMIEMNTHALSNMSSLTSSGDTIDKIASTTGENQHARIQMTFPSVYIPTGEDGTWAFAVGMLTSFQADFGLRRSFSLNPQTVIDAGPAVTVAKTLMDDYLSVGLTSHLTYRLATDQSMPMSDLIRGRGLSAKSAGGQGSHLDFDLGGTYWLPVMLDPENEDGMIQVGASINNLLGGNYSNMKLRANTPDRRPLAQPRTLGFGGSVHYDKLAFFTNTMFGLEFQDIGNNPNGSMFKTLHIGGEARYGILLPRLGINQGYFAAGLGLDLKVFTLDLATYGEEMSTNVGEMQDRRFAARIAFQI